MGSRGPRHYLECLAKHLSLKMYLLSAFSQLLFEVCVSVTSITHSEYDNHAQHLYFQLHVAGRASC